MKRFRQMLCRDIFYIMHSTFCDFKERTKNITWIRNAEKILIKKIICLKRNVKNNTQINVHICRW